MVSNYLICNIGDDTILFCPPELESLMNIKKTLILFQLASGLQVNFHKRSIVGINVDEEWLQRHSSNSLLCKIGSLPFTYLGLPIGGQSSRILMFSPIIEKLNGEKVGNMEGESSLPWRDINSYKSLLFKSTRLLLITFPYPKRGCGENYLDPKAIPMVRFSSEELPSPGLMEFARNPKNAWGARSW